MTALSTKIKTYMELNFDATNALMNLLNKHMTPSPNLRNINVKQDKSIGANAQYLIKVMEKIQKIVDQYDEDLSKTLEPTLYRQLKNPNLDFQKKIATAKQALTIAVGIAATVASIAVVVAIKTGVLLVSVVAKVGKIATGALAGLLVGVLALGIDAIASAIIGAIERDKLEDTIDDLQEALDEFQPASKEYYASILKVEILMETHLGVY